MTRLANAVLLSACRPDDVVLGWPCFVPAFIGVRNAAPPGAEREYFNGTIAAGTQADAVKLSVSLTFTAPSGFAATSDQVLRLLNTTNTTDPIESADRVFLPFGVPTGIFSVGGVPYALSIIGFGTATSEGFTSLDSFNVLEGGTASAGLFARVGRACVPAGGVLVQEAVTDFGRCGETSVGKKNPTWGGFGKRLDGTLHADSGERLDLECVGEAGTLPSFVLRYTSAEGSQHVVGVCPFEGGCNEVRFWHAGDSDGNGQPDCLVRTRWISKDYGSYDDRNPNPWTDISEPTDPYIDWAETIFDVNSTKVSKNDYKYTKLADYPISCSSGASPEGTLARTLAVDPLLGPETDAFFSAVLERFRLQPPGEAKGEASRRRCDLNGDGICDAADRARFAASLGSCRGEANYNPLPDGDADGCVTAQDETALFIADADGDEVPDDVDACPASNRSATVAIAGCESGVANRQLARGCTHTDEIAKCAATATNHGRFTSCVAKVGNALVSLGVITDAQQSAVQSCAARARIP